MKIITYEWDWVCLSLFRNDRDTETGIGGSSRMFTLKPSWVWAYWRDRLFMPPDPFEQCYQWLKRNHLWHLEGKAFLHAIARYAASCEPGHYLKLQPRFLK